MLNRSSAILLTLATLTMLGTGSVARELTLQQAFDIALSGTGQGMIIDGNLEVAEQTYFAEKINFYVPEISINGSVPAYNVSETYDFFPGTDMKGFGRSKGLNLDADITLKQNLFTGGFLELKANLIGKDGDYPLRISREVDNDTVYVTRTVDEIRKTSEFNFTLEQPILKPSEAKYQLRNSHDDLGLARLNRVEAAADLKSEIVTAFFGAMQMHTSLSISQAERESAELQAEIDSLKQNDGIIAEEDWLLSSSNRLDAELDELDAQSELAQLRRDLLMLLELDDEDGLPDLVLPDTVIHITENEHKALAGAWPDCVDIRRATLKHAKAERQADYAASSHGMTGTLAATYGMERGSIEENRTGQPKSQDLQTDSWGVSLNFSYPLWDGGASSAAVKAARLEAEQTRLELQKAEKSARADIGALINKVDLGHRKLSVLKRQIELAEDRLNIARDRHGDGQISKLTLLESSVSFLEATDKYLEEMKEYYLTRVELEGKYFR